MAEDDTLDPTAAPGPGEPLTEENYPAHVAAVPGIFGDTDTSGTAGPGAEVPTKNEEFAGTVVAETEAETGAEVAEARRQVDAAAGGTFAENVDAGAEEREEAEEGSTEPVNADAGADADENADDGPTAAEVVEEIKDAETVEEVDELADGDDRKTVQDAADTRRKQLSDSD